MVVTWHRPVEDGGLAICAYGVEMASSDSEWRELDGCPSSPEGEEAERRLEVSGLRPGQPYRFRVRAQNATGWSGFSDVQAAVTGNFILRNFFTSQAGCMP